MQAAVSQLTVEDFVPNSYRILEHGSKQSVFIAYQLLNRTAIQRIETSLKAIEVSSPARSQHCSQFTNVLRGKSRRLKN
ncbi:hypothetical protein A3768_5682 (plasmid) [Ralstonia solanacearum]|nr:hypothetical protein A3768_5682 [Ralstonia solanacearum]